MPRPITPLLEARNLVKTYPGVRAVDGVSLRIAEGICFGLLGPNGAGKSTTIEMLEGLLQPASGEILFRNAPRQADYREQIGLQFQHTALQDHLTVRENLRFFARLYPRHRPLEEIISECRLADFLDRDTRKLSGGQRQRVLLGLALVHDPVLLFLDEPTTGLDPQARRNFWELVTRIKQAGKTIVLTTHYMDEAYALCDQIAIMDHGRVIAEGTPRTLLAEHFADVVLELPAQAVHGHALALPMVHKGEVVEIISQSVNEALAQLLAAGVELSRLHIRPRSLEDLFITLTGKELRG